MKNPNMPDMIGTEMHGTDVFLLENEKAKKFERVEDGEYTYYLDPAIEAHEREQHIEDLRRLIQGGVL